MPSHNSTRDRARLTHLLGMRHTRVWEDAHLPIYGSLLGRDLVLLLTQLHLESRTLSLKEIYLSLPYSENAIRLHLQRLERGAWIRMDGTASDKRFKAIRLTRKFDVALNHYLRVLSNYTQQPAVIDQAAPAVPLFAPPVHSEDIHNASI